MMIVAFFLFVFGVYWFVMRWRNKNLPEHERQFGARVGRSVHAAVPIPGFAGQSPPDHFFEPYKESVGPEESHTLVLDAKGQPLMNDENVESTLGPYRDPDVAAPRDEKGKKKRKTKNGVR